MKKTLPLILLVLLICACSDRKEAHPDSGAWQLLHAARTLMSEKSYDAARDSVLRLRRQFPKAFEARTAGIIVTDSIELLEAQDSLMVLDSILQTEKAYFGTLQKRNNRGNNAEYYTQRTKVFHLEQQHDEVCAKIKFYMRKIELDKTEKAPQ